MSDEERDYALGDMDRRIGNMLREGTVVAVDFTNAAAPRVKVDLGEFITDWLPWLAGRAGHTRVWAPPDILEQVAVLSPGDPSQGLVLPGGIFSDAFQANGNAAKDTRITFKDGTVVEFDRDSSALRVIVNPAGDVLVTVGATEFQLHNGTARLKAAAITLDGAVTVTGATTIQGLTSMQASASVTGTLTNNGVNTGSNHTHTEQGDGAEVSGPH